MTAWCKKFFWEEMEFGIKRFYFLHLTVGQILISKNFISLFPSNIGIFKPQCLLNKPQNRFHSNLSFQISGFKFHIEKRDWVSDEEHKNVCKWHKFQVKSLCRKNFVFCENRINHRKNDDTIACQLRLATSLWICNSMLSWEKEARKQKIWMKTFGEKVDRREFLKVPRTFVKF